MVFTATIKLDFSVANKLTYSMSAHAQGVYQVDILDLGGARQLNNPAAFLKAVLSQAPLSQNLLLKSRTRPSTDPTQPAQKSRLTFICRPALEFGCLMTVQTMLLHVHAQRTACDPLSAP